MIEDTEGATHKQDLANCEPLRILLEKVKNVKEQLSSEACIFKVHEMLRKPNPEAYTPLTISIGPYHHGKSELRKMEWLKVLYTQSFMGRLKGLHIQSLLEGVDVKELYTESSLLEGVGVEELLYTFNRADEGAGVEECWKKLKELEGRAKSYYGDDIDEEISGDEFVKMLLLDGCFIVEFVIRSCVLEIGMGQRQYKCDPICMMIRGMESNIVRDMLLLENQLPFFVLQAFYDMIISTLPVNLEFSEMVKIAFRETIPKMNIISLLNTEVNPQEIRHLLEIVHILCQPQNNGWQIQQQKACSSSCCFWKQPQGQGRSDIEPQNLSNGQDRHRWQFFTCFLSKFWEQPQQSIDDDDNLLCSIRTASELQEAGVHFKKVGKISNDDNSNQIISLLDIKFNKHGVLEIPSFALCYQTETFLRNLIAYEQHSRYVYPMYFTDYAKFMDGLINTEKDVSLLRLKDVFINGLGDDKEVTRLFNNLGKGVMYYSNDYFYYKDVCRELNRHCKKPWNEAMPKLRRNYFHSPWAGISTFAAILLLSLAIAQTVLSALDLHK